MLRYLVITKRNPEFKPTVVEAHYAFLDQLRRQGILEMSGPFTDKSGGAYILKVENLEAAKAIAFADPLHTTQSSFITVHEWNAK